MPPKTLPPINLATATPLGEGTHRVVLVQDTYALKVLKPFVRVCGIPLPTCMYTQLAYGIRNVNCYELQQYRELRARLPEKYNRHFAEVLTVQAINGKNVSINELVTNADGTVASTLAQYGRVGDSAFWARLALIEDVLAERAIPYLDPGPKNVVVQQTENGLVPVFVDHKRIGRAMYRFQFGTWSKEGMLKKMQRKFARMREQYQLQ